MREFLILFKHELKMLLPVLSFKKKKKYDFFGAILSLILIVGVAALFIGLVSQIAEGYVLVKVNKTSNPAQRAVELFNILYCFIILLMVVGCTRKLVATLTMKQNKQIYLRLPVKQQYIFLAKLAAVMIWNFVACAILILPINIVFYIILNPTFVFWLKTAFVLIFMPMVVIGISTILLVPCIKLVDFFKGKYLALFICLSMLLIGAFVIYSQFLEIVQLLLETGSIKFLFNAGFVSTLQNWYKYAYPVNCFANIMMGNKVVLSTIIILLGVAASIALAYFVSSKLFNLTLYKNKREFKVKKPRSQYCKHSQIVALMKKEFICVYRSPKNLFSYFAIAISMPVMVYCCYTLFESLIVNAFGIKITFSLALLVLLMFSVLTNTFCATNVTRDGVSFLKMKSWVVKPAHVLLAKVLFCGIVSSISIIISATVLLLATSVTIWDAVICVIIASAFSFAQILVATKLDLNHAKLSATPAEAEATSSKTITKVVLIGLCLALAMGITSVMVYLLAEGGGWKLVKGLDLKQIYAYILPIAVCVAYVISAIVYYRYKIDKSFNLLDR